MVKSFTPRAENVERIERVLEKPLDVVDPIAVDVLKGSREHLLVRGHATRKEHSTIWSPPSRQDSIDPSIRPCTHVPNFPTH